MEKRVYLQIDNSDQFFELLKVNPGVIIIKFTATWCKPCKKIKNQVNKHFLQTKDNIICFDLDVDDMFELYSFFQRKRLLNGIPAIFAYHKNNLTHHPDDSISGADTDGIDNFFNNINK